MSRHDPSARAPRIVVTLAVPDDQAEPELQVRRNDLYVAALARHGAVPVRLDARMPIAVRTTRCDRCTGCSSAAVPIWIRAATASRSTARARSSPSATSSRNGRGGRPNRGTCPCSESAVASRRSTCSRVDRSCSTSRDTPALAGAPGHRRRTHSGSYPARDSRGTLVRRTRSRSTPITTREFGNPTWHRGSVRPRGQTAPPAPSSRVWRAARSGSSSGCSATRSEPNRHRRRSSSCLPRS